MAVIFLSLNYKLIKKSALFTASEVCSFNNVSAIKESLENWENFSKLLFSKRNGFRWHYYFIGFILAIALAII